MLTELRLSRNNECFALANLKLKQVGANALTKVHNNVANPQIQQFQDERKLLITLYLPNTKNINQNLQVNCKSRPKF